MSKRTIYTIVTPLPKTIRRDTAVKALHNHGEMIELNPLVISHVPCKAPPQAPPDEFHAIWYELTDKISYLPGIKGSVNYKACFHNLPKGLQTHIYAPAGLEIKEKWAIGGNEQGEEREILELGLHGVPREGLYLREDVDMKCNMLMTSFVKKTLKKAHAVLVERLLAKADLEEDRAYRANFLSPKVIRSNPNSPSVSSIRTAQTPRSTHMREVMQFEMPGDTDYAELPTQNALGIGIAVSSPHPSYHEPQRHDRDRHPSVDDTNSTTDTSSLSRSISMRSSNRYSMVHNFSSPNPRQISPTNTSPTNYSPTHLSSPAPPYSRHNSHSPSFAELPATEKAAGMRDVQVRYPTETPPEELERGRLDGIREAGSTDALDVVAPLRVPRRTSDNYSAHSPALTDRTVRYELE
ncbi:hypothetical protein MBLNU457_1435t1 [Dothideomycetes sp. NU457]